MSREDRKNSKYILREADRQLKERTQYSALQSDAKPKEKPKQKWRPRGEQDDD